VLIFDSKFTSIEAIIVRFKLVLGKTCLKKRFAEALVLKVGTRWRFDKKSQLLSAVELQLMQNKNNNNNKGLNNIQL
jgi:hypothetical protein